MQTVIETNAFLASASKAGISDDERAQLVDYIAADPTVGAIMQGCGGARKVRVAATGGGKSGGFRVITFYGGGDIPVFLLTVYPKTMKESLTDKEKNILATITKEIKATYGRR
ncbi:hypothetical protein HNO88_002769 [Novosphingobium chloroacetimidivorans]|uniref:Addiction module toxin RelE n=1 Tax=Novosphingobium chloroacetimidivorans TaxID=1428314 RepID=A0A7W7KBB4_9SPHN|nr:type II toxin-antitoxin system RelE/ParE family toxin [Novosphingobium chloroacetimidivorans]MBB4859440.1 hypothetical protein [Novosphingobium chloroacetimidivorans]